MSGNELIKSPWVISLATSIIATILIKFIFGPGWVLTLCIILGLVILTWVSWVTKNIRKLSNQIKHMSFNPPMKKKIPPPNISENDALNKIECWLRPKIPSSPLTIVFTDLDEELNFPPGTTQQYIKKAAINLNYKIKRTGETTIEIDWPPEDRRQTLPYKEVIIGTYVIKDLANVSIKANILLIEQTKPNVDIFVQRISISEPYCKKCEEPMVPLVVEVMLTGKQIGYQCEKHNIKIKKIKADILNEVIGEVRRNYNRYWEKYKDEISALTNGDPKKFKLT